MNQLCAKALTVGDLTRLKSEFKMFLDLFLIPSNAGTLLPLLLFIFISFSYVIMCVSLSILVILVDGLWALIRLCQYAIQIKIY